MNSSYETRSWHKTAKTIEIYYDKKAQLVNKTLLSQNDVCVQMGKQNYYFKTLTEPH